jgi:hypothetical protein
LGAGSTTTRTIHCGIQATDVTTVGAAFESMLADLRVTERQKVIANGRITHLDAFFRANYRLAKAPWAIGSYNRETLIRWERDVDVMVALSTDPYWSRFEHDSAKFLNWIRDGLNREYRAHG